MERAPSAFARLKFGEFRLLLSSARSGQKSWETLDGKGTLFSRTLVEILDGTRVVGRGDGSVYFSDLIQGLEAGIAEKRDEQRNLPEQDMVFVGSYTSDPLVLVMRGQTLDAVKFATARYSPRQLRRMARDSALVIFGLFFFIAVSWYGIIDATQYVTEEGGRLIAYKGHPRFSLPGYPQSLWTYPYGSERLESGPRALPLIAPLGDPVGPVVNTQLNPLLLAEQQAQTGHPLVARESAKRLIGNPKIPFETQFGARLLLADVAIDDDVKELLRWTYDQRSDIRLAALRALLRLAPKQGLDRANLDLAATVSIDHADILRRLDLPCEPALETYFDSVASIQGTSPSVALILDASVRSGCTLSSAAIGHLIARLQFSDAGAMAGFFDWRDAASDEKSKTDQFVPSDSSDWRWILVQAFRTHAACDPAWNGILAEAQPKALALAPALIATARHCPGARLVIRWTNLLGLMQLTLQREDGAVQHFDGVFANDNRDELIALLPAISRAVRPDLAAVRGTVGLTIDDRFRAALLDLLVRWGDKESTFGDRLDANDLDLRRAYVEHERISKGDQIARQLVDRIGRSDGFYTTLLGRIPLSPAVKALIEEKLSGTSEERRSASCVLAMQAPASEVMSLLTNVDGDIRTEAADCVSYNQAVAEIAATLPRTTNHFPIESYSSIQEQTKLKQTFQAHLASISANLRAWRLELADTTPGMFGLWDRGMREWFAEQRYQSRLAERPMQ